jgi:hypothetical protein
MFIWVERFTHSTERTLEREMKRTATTALRFAGTSARPSTVALRHLVCAVLCVPSLSPSLRSPPPGD